MISSNKRGTPTIQFFSRHLRGRDPSFSGIRSDGTVWQIFPSSQNTSHELPSDQDIAVHQSGQNRYTRGNLMQSGCLATLGDTEHSRSLYSRLRLPGSVPPGLVFQGSPTVLILCHGYMIRQCSSTTTSWSGHKTLQDRIRSRTLQEFTVVQ